MDHAPQPGVMLVHQPCRRLDWHVRNHRHEQRFEQQCEAAAGPRPRHLDQPFATLVTVDAWNAGGEDRMELEKVQMPPAALFGVVGLTASLAALGAGKGATTFEVDTDIQLTLVGVQIVAHHDPWLVETESEGEEVFAVHAPNNKRRPCDRLVRPTHDCPLGGCGSVSSRLGGGGLDTDPLPPNHPQARVEPPLYDIKLPT